MIDKRIMDSNLFNVENPSKFKLIFITQKGHLTGKIMKGMDFRQPKIIEELKVKLEEKNEIGDVIIIKNNVFVIYRKHYNSRVDGQQFEKILKKALPSLSGMQFKTTNEDLPQFQKIILKYLPDIEYRESSEWPHK